MVAADLEARGLPVFDGQRGDPRGAARADLRDGRDRRPRRAPRQPAAEADPDRAAARARSTSDGLHRRRATGDGLAASAASKPERWVRQTDFTNDEAVGYLADRLARLGVEDALVELGRRGRRRGRHRRRRQRRGLRLGAHGRGRRRAPARAAAARTCASRAAERAWPVTAVVRGPSGRGQGRLVVADRPPAGGIDAGAVDALVDVARRQRARRAARSCWSPPARSPPGSRRSASARRPARPRHPAGRGERRPGPARAPLHRGVRPARHHRRPGAADRRRRDPARHYRNAHRTFDRLLELGVAARSSTRTTPWPPTRSGSATTTGWPRWSRTWCTPTCWCCSPTSTACTTATRAEPGARAAQRRARRPTTSPASRSAGRARPGVGTGGMATKVEAARIATGAGIPVVAHLGRARPPRRWPATTVGTLLPPDGRARARPGCSGWRTRPTPRGRLLLDDGAVRAVVDRRRRCCPPAITGGRRRLRGRRPGRPGRPERRRRSPAGWSTTTPTSCRALLGRSTRDLARELGPAYEREVVHRDDLVLL